METIKQLLAAGQLEEAIAHAQNTLREKPAATDVRACLIELLAIDGQLERADEILMSLAKHQPGWLAGAANLRQLLKAQQTRMALLKGQLADDVVATEGSALDAFVSLNLRLTTGDLDGIDEEVSALETSRTPAEFLIGDVSGDLRDCDDILNGFFEGLGTDGHYYLWSWASIRAVEFHRPESPVEMVWRRATVEVEDGRQGELFVPLTYGRSETPTQKLGRETDWQELAPGVVAGVGLKMLLVGESAIPLDGIGRIERVSSATEVSTKSELAGSH